MAEEKQVSTKYVEIKMSMQNKANSEKNNKLNENTATKEIHNKKNDFENENEKGYQEYQSNESSDTEDENINESIIDREIRLALEREEKLREEHELVLKELELAQKTDEKLVTESSHDHKSKLKHEKDNSWKAENIIEMEIRAQQRREEEFRHQAISKECFIANKEDKQSEDEHNEKMAEFNAHESLLEKEIRLQKERESEIEKQRIFAQKLYEKHFELQENNENFQSQPSSEGSSESAYYSSAENLIAQEIRELQEREEELRIIHEQMINKTTESTELTNNNLNFSLKPDTSMPRCMSPDSISSSQDSSSGEFINRSERIKVRPYEEPSSDVMDSMYVPLNETPIEKEIRLLHEREEALRKEKESLSLAENEEKSITKKEKINISKLKTNSSFENVKNVQDTQKHLATTLLQKEIEEQKQRELDLFKSGHIKTISEELTDIVGAKSMENLIGDYGAENIHQMAHVSRSVSLQNFMSKDDSDLPYSESSFKLPSPLSPNLLAPFNNPGPPPTPQVVKPGSATKASHNPQGIILPKTLPQQSSTLPRKVSAHNFVKNVSMEKFISRHGKKKPPLLNTFLIDNHSAGETQLFHKSDYDDLTVLRISKPNEDLRPSSRRIYQTAESKIEQELKDMKEREEELKKQRELVVNSELSNPSTSSPEKNEVISNKKSPKQKKKTAVKHKKGKEEERKPRSPQVLISQWEEIIHQQE